MLPHFEKIKADDIKNLGISPTGKRAVFEAHGEILTVPAEKGDIRNLTRSPAVADRDPAWSPDGKSIAWFSDESGEYALHIRDQNGLGEVRKITLDQPPSFYYSPTWSPDSRKIAYCDKRLNLWYVDLTNGIPVKVDTDYYDEGPSPFNVTWSPDSRWLAYNRILPSLPARDVRVLAGNEEKHPDHRRNERRALSGIRPERQVSLLRRQHRFWPYRRRRRHVGPSRVR